MELNSKHQPAKFWCIDFGSDDRGGCAARKLHPIFKRVTPDVVFGTHRVFLDVSHSKWCRSLTLFQVKLAEAAKKHGMNPDSWQWGTGSTVAESWVRARYETLTLELLPVEAISDFLNPLDHLKKTSSESRKYRILRSLGVNTLQDLTEIPEEVLLSQCGLWIAEFTRDHFSAPEKMRDIQLERTTADSLLNSDHPFHLEDWIPETYLAVG
ncbi:MAG: hypothetical protein H7333_04295 [Bdellovibrionales bacterium]|nr:hypothetical protein [Oligoflexia bacterium]